MKQAGGLLFKFLLLALFPILVASLGQGNIFGLVRKRLEFMRLVQEFRYQEVQAGGDTYKLVVDVKNNKRSIKTRSRRLSRDSNNRKSS